MVDDKKDDVNTKRSFTSGDSDESSVSSISTEPTVKKPKLEDETDSDKTGESSHNSNEKLSGLESEHSNTQKSETDNVKSDSENVKFETSKNEKIKSATAEEDKIKSETSVEGELSSETSEADAVKLKAAEIETVTEQPVSLLELPAPDELNPDLDIEYSMYRPGIMNLCDDVLLNIMRHCSARDRKALAFSCRRLNELSRDRTLWGRMDLRSDPVGRKQLTWFLNEFADKHTTAVMLRGHAESSRGCMGKIRTNPESEKDTNNVNYTGASRLQSFMQQNHPGSIDPQYHPGSANLVGDDLPRARERRTRNNHGPSEMTDKAVQTEKSELIGVEINNENESGELQITKCEPATKKQKIDPSSIAGTSGVGGHSVRNVGKIEIIRTPKNGSPKETKMEIDDQKPGPSNLHVQDYQKPGPSGIKLQEVQDDQKPGPSVINKFQDDEKPGPSGIQVQEDKKLASSSTKEEETGKNIGKVEIVRAPKKDCTKKIENIRKVFERMRRELRRKGIDYSGLDKIRACLNEKACQTGSDEDSLLTDCQSKADDDIESCSVSSLSTDSENSSSVEDNGIENDRVAHNNVQDEKVPPMVRGYNFFPELSAQTPANIARRNALEGVAEPTILRGDNNDRERNQRLAALDLSGQNMGGNDENYCRQHSDNAEQNALNFEANGNNGQNAANNRRNVHIISQNADNVGQSADNNGQNVDIGQNADNIGQNAAIHVEDIINMAQNAANIAQDIHNMANRVAANLQEEVVQMALNRDGNVEVNGENNVENADINLDRVEPLEDVVEFAMNAVDRANEDFGFYGDDVAENNADAVENAIDNMAGAEVVEEANDEVALDLALDAAERADQVADIPDNAAIIAENVAGNNVPNAHVVENEADMIDAAFNIALERVLDNGNQPHNANNANPVQQNVIYMAFQGYARDNENNNAENGPQNEENNAIPNANADQNNVNNPVLIVQNDVNPVENGVDVENVARNDLNAAQIDGIIANIAQNDDDGENHHLNDRFGPIGHHHGWHPFREFRIRRYPAEQNRPREPQYYIRGAEQFRPGVDFCDHYWPTLTENEKALKLKRREAKKQIRARKLAKSGGKHVKRVKKKKLCSGPKWTVNSAILRQLAETCPNLTELSLENCNINTHMVKLSDFPRKLKILSLKGCHCYNTVVNKSFLFKVQDHLPHLENMDISDCSWIGAASLLPLSKLEKLRVLKACNCVKMTECVAYASLAARFGFRSLEVLDLRGSPMGDSEISAFGWLPNLREMYLSPPTNTTNTPPSPIKHMHALSDNTTDSSDVEPWEGDEDSPEISFRTAERAYCSNIPRHCCLDPQSGCQISDEDPALLDSRLNVQHCSPEICTHTHRFTQEDKERIAKRQIPDANHSLNVREIGLEREIARRVGELLRRREEEINIRAAEQPEEDRARARGEEDRPLFPGDRAGNAEQGQGNRRPRRNVEDVMRAWENLAQEWHFRERNRNRVRRMNMQGPVEQFREQPVGEPREDVHVDAGGRFHMIYVNARRPRQDLAHGHVRIEAPNNARPPDEPPQREEFVNIQRDPRHRLQGQWNQGAGHVNQAPNHEPDQKNQVPPGCIHIQDGTENRGPAARNVADQDPLVDNLDPVEHNPDLEHNDAHHVPVGGNLQANGRQHHAAPAANHQNPADPYRNFDLREQWGQNIPHVLNLPPYRQRINDCPNLMNRSPYHVDQARREADQALRQADQARREADQALRLADQNCRVADQALRQADQDCRAADRVLREPDQDPRQADQDRREAIQVCRVADRAIREARQARIQAEEVIRHAHQANVEANQVLRENLHNLENRIPAHRNRGLEWQLGPDHILRLEGQQFPPGANLRPQAPVNVRRDYINGPAHLRFPNQEGFRMNIQLHRQIYLDQGLIRANQEAENPPIDVEPLQRPAIGIMRVPLVQNILYGPHAGHIDGSSLISDSSLLRFGLSAGNHANYVHIGANGALQAVFPHANWTDKPDKARLEIIVVRGYTGVTNRTLQHFATAAPQLREIDLTDTSVTLQGVESFSAIRPDVKVICDHLKEKPVESTQEE